jgi:hypothetical protein
MRHITNLEDVRAHIAKCKRDNTPFDWPAFIKAAEAITSLVDSLFWTFNGRTPAHDWVNGNAALKILESGVTKFAVGQKVKYTNGNGVYIGIKTIVSIADNGRYFLAPTDTPWHSISEDSLKEIKL